MDQENSKAYSAGGSLTHAGQGRLQSAVATTLRENLDYQILMAKKHVEDLQATKARMETSGILDMRIEDIRQTMNY